MSAGIRVVPVGKQYFMLRRGVGPIFAGKGGRLLLKTEVRWWHFSGFWLNTRKGCVWFYFRRIC